MDSTTAAPEATVEQQTEEDLVGIEKKDDKPYGDHIGQVKWFNPKLGYGFITFCDGDDKGKDIFVHHSGLKPLSCKYNTLEMGEYIQFNVVDGQNGLQAVNVTGIRGGPLMCDVVFKRTSSLNPVAGTHVPTYRPQTIPGNVQGSYVPHQPRNQWQNVPGRKQPKNKLKYSKEGREIMKAAKKTVPPPPPRSSTRQSPTRSVS